MSGFTSGNFPGAAPRIDSDERQVWWSGRGGQNLIATRPVALDAASRDEGNAPDTTLRGGCLLALDDASGKAHPYVPDANDGRQVAAGVLERAQDMLVAGAPADRFVSMLVHGLLKEGELIGLDQRAKAQLAGRFLFDRDLGASAGWPGSRAVYRGAGTCPVPAATHGALWLGVDAVDFLLPEKENGLAFRFLQTADETMTIASGQADLLVPGNAASSLLSFSGSGSRLGAQVLVECAYIAPGTLRWLVTNLGGVAWDSE